MTALAFNDRYQTTTPALSTDPQSVDFAIFSTVDLDVFVDGVETTDFTIAATFTDGVSSNAVVTIITPVVSSPTVEIVGAREPRRDQFLIAAGAQLVAAINADLARRTAESQELFRDMVLAIKVPVGEVLNNVLPNVADRASKYLFFAGDGSVGVTGTAPAVQYQGAFNDANEPTLRLSGGALEEGDLYFNTTSDVLKIYNGVSWLTPTTPAAASVTVADDGEYFDDVEVEAVLQDIGANYAKLAGPAFTGTVTGEAMDLSGPVSMAGAFLLSGAISPSQITGNQNNYNPSGLSGAVQLRLNSDASRNITGLVGGATGRLLMIANIGSTDIVLVNQSGSSSAANRFLFAAGDRTLTADESVLMRYDGTSSRWRAAHDVIVTAGVELVAKTADETVNNSTTFQNDDHLLFALEANTTYLVDVNLLLSATNATPDFKFKWTFPTSCTIFWQTVGSNSWTVSGTVLLDQTDEIVKSLAVGTGGVLFRAFVRNSSNAGNLQLLWAQNGAHASDSKVLKNSHLIIRNLGAT